MSIKTTKIWFGFYNLKILLLIPKVDSVCVVVRTTFVPIMLFPTCWINHNSKKVRQKQNVVNISKAPTAFHDFLSFSCQLERWRLRNAKLCWPKTSSPLPVLGPGPRLMDTQCNPETVSTSRVASQYDGRTNLEEACQTTVWLTWDLDGRGGGRQKRTTKTTTTLGHKGQLFNDCRLQLKLLETWLRDDSKMRKQNITDNNNKKKKKCWKIVPHNWWPESINSTIMAPVQTKL